MSFSSLAADWQWVRDEDGVRIATRPSRDGIHEVLAETTTTTRLSAFVALLDDFAANPRWVTHSKGVVLLEKPTPTSDLIYTQFDLPWPAHNRDMVTLSTWSQDRDGVLYLTLEDAGDRVLAQPGFVRMQNVAGQWSLTPLPDGRVRIRYQGHADPAGQLPHWLVNEMTTKATFETFVKMRRLLDKGKYQDSSYPFVREPQATRTRAERR
ncbi:START domain-containing protein [Gallaecimonas sp. GXIMD4217]|uniref:START domain-containing protein n=1 Tax=Gallaecimonas sp. GXIMD4217 TaxID=3131927 RepID=UPI00311B05D6